MRHTKTQRSSIAGFLFLLLAISAPVGQTQAQNPESARLLTQPKVKTLPAKAKRWALVIGVDKYDDENITPLKGATNDANEIARALREYAGFDENQIILLTNEQKAGKQPTRRNILKYLSNLKGLVPKDGLLLISFSGHGIERNGRAFLIPYDAAYTEDVSFLEETAISADKIKQDIKESGVSQVLILLDACRNDPAGGKADSINPLSDAYRRGFEFDVRNQEITAFATLYATSIGARAYEDVEKKEGYFTLAVVEALRGKAADPKTGEVTLQNLVSYIETNVPIRVAVNLGARKVQRPFAVIEGFRASELVLAVGPVEPDFGSTTGPADNEREAFIAIQNSTALNEIRAVLEEYPTSRYAPDLRKRLERLVWESAKAGHDKVRLQAYLDEFGDKAQFASLARIEIRKLTPVQPKASSTPTANNDSSTTSASIVVTSSSKAASLANQALSEILIGNDETANRLADEALQLNKDSPLALAVRGWAKWALNAEAGIVYKPPAVLSASQDLERAEKLEPKNPLFRARLISVYKDLDKASDSMNAAKKVLSLLATPVTSLDYYSRGLAHAGLGHSIEAVGDFTKAIELNPNFALAYFGRGMASGSAETTRADLLQAVKINPQFWRSKNTGYKSRSASYRYVSSVYAEGAQKFHDEKKYDEAISEFTRAIELYPSLTYYQNRGFAYLKKKDYEAAIRDFDVVLTNDPNWSGKDVYYHRAQAHKELGHRDQAIADFSKAIERAPQGNDSFSYITRGNIYQASEDYQSAIRDYTKAIELEPKNAIAYSNRGISYYTQKDYQTAIRDLTKAIELDPQNASNYSSRGHAYFGERDYKAAIRDYTKAIELDPRSANYYDNRGSAYYNDRDYQAAIRDCTKAIELDPKDAFPYNIRALAYEQIGRNDLAQADRQMYEKLK